MKIPDRLSVDINSAYFNISAFNKNFKVYLNDELNTKCVEYCISEGWIICLRAALPEEDQTIWHKEKLTGTIKVEIEP